MNKIVKNYILFMGWLFSYSALANISYESSYMPTDVPYNTEALIDDSTPVGVAYPARQAGVKDKENLQLARYGCPQYDWECEVEEEIRREEEREDEREDERYRRRNRRSDIVIVPAPVPIYTPLCYTWSGSCPAFGLLVGSGCQCVYGWRWEWGTVW